jgi:hypothetical protein
MGANESHPTLMNACSVFRLVWPGADRCGTAWYAVLHGANASTLLGTNGTRAWMVYPSKLTLAGAWKPPAVAAASLPSLDRMYVPAPSFPSPCFDR